MTGTVLRAAVSVALSFIACSPSPAPSSTATKVGAPTTPSPTTPSPSRAPDAAKAAPQPGCTSQYPRNGADDLGPAADVDAVVQACKAAKLPDETCDATRFISLAAAKCEIAKLGALTGKPALRFKPEGVAWCEEKAEARTGLPQWVCVNAATGVKLGPAVRIVGPWMDPAVKAAKNAVPDAPAAP